MVRPERPGRAFLGVDIDKFDFGFLKEYAEKDDRPVAALVRRIIREWVEQQRKLAMQSTTKPPAGGPSAEKPEDENSREEK